MGISAARFAVVLAFVGHFFPLEAAAETIIVGKDGPIPTFAEAVRVARDGDTIAILPGEYRGDIAVIDQKRLTVRGIGARPIFVADGKVAEDKAIWVVRDGDVTIENIEFRGARAPDLNGAGIRFQNGRLTVRRCAFFDNENGILTANFPKAELVIEDSEFAHLPQIAGQNHLLYVGQIRKLTIRGSRFHRGALGHMIKSRARETLIAYNLIIDGPQGNASYQIDLPNGGEATLIGNVIAKGPSRDNPVAVAFAAEGSKWDRNALVLSHNTLVNDGWKPTWFLRVWAEKLPPDTSVRAINNLSVGLGLFTLGARGRFDGNWPALRGMLAAPDALDFALPPDSLLRGRGKDPAAIDPQYVPRFEFQVPIGTVPIVAPRQWSPGAFQR
jgi:hypothetical protein